MLGAMAGRGETAAEIAGFVDALRSAATPIPLTDAEREELVDTCGTGGDRTGTFNISTAAALVAAAAGAKVAKHGNRAVTSRCGSADVLEALGIPVNLSADAAAAAIRQHGFAYLHAPAMHPAMKAVLPVRVELGVRTIFNLLGPLTNPAGARRQVVGVYAADRVEVLAEALLLLEARHAFVVHGNFPAGSLDLFGVTSPTGMDEFSISGASRVAEVRDGRIMIKDFLPEEAGVIPGPIRALGGSDARTNAEVLRRIFMGEQSPRREVVVLNAAAVLVVAGLATDLKNGVQLARETIDAGKVSTLVRALAQPSAASSGTFQSGAP